MAKAAPFSTRAPSAGTRPGSGSAAAPRAGLGGASWRSGRRLPAPGVRGAAAAGRPLLRLVEVETSESERIPTGVAELDRVLGGGLVPASLVLVSGDPGIGKSTLLLMALRAMSGERTAVLVTGEESAAQVKLRADRLGGAAEVRILAETNLDEVCATLEQRAARRVRGRLGPDPLRTRARLRAGIGRAGARGCRPLSPRRQGAGNRHLPRRSRDEGRRGRRTARPRAPRRLRAPLRGRPLPLAPRPARGQEPLRLDERARRLRDDLGRAGRRGRPLGAVRAPRRGAARVGRRLHDRGHSTAPARGAGARLTDRPRHAAAGRHGRRPEAALDDRRRARPPRRRRARPGRRVRQRRRRRPHRRARRRPRRRARDRLGGARPPREARRLAASARSVSPAACVRSASRNGASPSAPSSASRRPSCRTAPSPVAECA